MIFNTYYWKRELIRLARVLRRHMAQRQWRASSDASVEKCVMLGFYAIRKMLESFNPALKSPERLRLTTFPTRRARLSPIAFPDVAEAFDLAKPRAESMLLRHVCNEVVHSYFFSLWVGPDRALRGIFFSSDQKKNKRVCRLDIEAIVTLFEGIARSRTAVSLAHFYPEHTRVIM